MSNIRPPTKKKSNIPPTRDPFISDGNEKKVLTGIQNNGGKITNVRRFADQTRIPRTTIRDTLKRLINKGYIDKPYLGVYVLSDKGKQIITALDSVAGSSVGGGGSEGRFSTHYLKYTAKITSTDYNWKERLKQLTKKTHETNNTNNPVTYAYFEDCTAIIHKHKIIIRIHDIINNDSEIALLESFNKALDKFADFKKIGIISEGMILEDSHYALMNTYFAEALDKLQERYFITLNNGSKFWIDKSHGKAEVESNKKQLIENIDTFIKYEADNDIVDELEQIKRNLLELTEYNLNQAEVLKHQTKLTQTELTGVFESLKALSNSVQTISNIFQPKETQQEQTELKERPRYIN